ncbi:MAG: hypothetical protein ACRETA_05770 [Gammaproteobacteria bacterium]
MCKYLVIAALLVLCGCAAYPSGDDPYGQRLQAAATPVLVAIQTYMNDNARLPRSLNDLVPKYIKQLPDEPKLTYDMKDNTITFQYIRGMSNGTEGVCTAFIGQTSWSCL